MLQSRYIFTMIYSNQRILSVKIPNNVIPMYKPTLYLFGKYASISVLNTVVHWLVFFFLLYAVTLDQAWSNVIAYMFALTFSFHVNARFTFKSKVNKRR